MEHHTRTIFIFTRDYFSPPPGLVGIELQFQQNYCLLCPLSDYIEQDAVASFQDKVYKCSTSVSTFQMSGQEAVDMSCPLCGASVKQLFNNPAHRKILARLLETELEKIPRNLCMVCTVKTQTVNEFQEFCCKHLKIKVPT